MEEIEFIIKVLKICALALFASTLIFFRKGRSLARMYKQPRKYDTGRLPHKFSEDSLLQAAKFYSRKNGHALAFDTDVILDNPYVLVNIAKVTNVQLLISQQVRYELDKWKDSGSELSQAARIALRGISNLHKEGRLELLKFDRNFVKEAGLRPNVNDDVIIGTYLEKTSEYKEIVFITNDNNSRTTARTTSLEALELDWNKESGKSSNIQARPGYTYKLISLISFSLVIGNIMGWFYMDAYVRAEYTGTSSSKTVFSTESPAYTDGEFNYLIKNEYGEIYKGKKLKDWGGTAVIDAGYTEKAGLIPLNEYRLLLGGWTEKDIEDKRNVLTHRIIMADGTVIEQKGGTDRAYNPDSGVNMESIDTRMKFEGINYSESASFEMTPGQHGQLEGAKVEIIHKVTKEVVGTLPLKIQKSKAEGGEKG